VKGATGSEVAADEQAQHRGPEHQHAAPGWGDGADTAAEVLCGEKRGPPECRDNNQEESADCCRTSSPPSRNLHQGTAEAPDAVGDDER